MPKGPHAGFRHQDAHPRFHCPPPPPPPSWGWRWFASREGEWLLQESRGTAAAQRGVGSSGCNRRGWTRPVAALARGDARESAAAAAQGHALAAGCCWWATVRVRNYQPGGYTRHSKCSPPGKGEGSRAPGHAETKEGGRRRNTPPHRAGVREGLWGKALAWCLRTQPAQPACRRARVPGALEKGEAAASDGCQARCPRDVRTLREGLTWRAFGRQRVCSMPWRARGCSTPHPAPCAHGKGLVVPRDSGPEPEPLRAFTPQARPEASGCLGPSAPPEVWCPDSESA